LVWELLDFRWVKEKWFCGGSFPANQVFIDLFVLLFCFWIWIEFSDQVYL
jgi:hypothetical protein